MIHITDMAGLTDTQKDELRTRLTQIKKWTKDNGVYGGAYPDGISYFIFAMTTVQNGYRRDDIWRLLHQKSMYYHTEYKYSHIQYVSDRHFDVIRRKTNLSFSYMTDQCTHHYQLSSPKMSAVLRSHKYLYEKEPIVSSRDLLIFMENEGTIYSSHDVYNAVLSWVGEL